MNIVVYTCITGGKDLLQPIKPEEGIEYYYYSEQPINNHNVWKYKQLEYSNTDPRRTARYHKIKGLELFPEADYIIWIDANIKSLVPIKNLLDCEIKAIKHPGRNCLYQEAETCKRLKLDSENIINKQIKKYSDEEIPKDYGLYETGFLIRKNTEKNKKLCNDWWKEVNNYSRRDQISFPYCLLKNNITCCTMNRAKVCKIFSHKKKN